jgi:hypothetical protein
LVEDTFIFRWKHLFYFGSTGVWTQGLVFARQKLNHLRHTFSTFWFGYLWDRVLQLCPGHPGLQSSYLCFPPAVITGVHHQALPQLLICWYSVLWTFLPVVTSNCIILMAASPVGRIIAWTTLCLFLYILKHLEENKTNP